MLEVGVPDSIARSGALFLASATGSNKADHQGVMLGSDPSEGDLDLEEEQPNPAPSAPPEIEGEPSPPTPESAHWSPQAPLPRTAWKDLAHLAQSQPPTPPPYTEDSPLPVSRYRRSLRQTLTEQECPIGCQEVGLRRQTVKANRVEL